MFSKVCSVGVAAFKNGVAALALLSFGLVWSVPFSDNVKGGMPASSGSKVGPLAAAVGVIDRAEVAGPRVEASALVMPPPASASSGMRYAIGDRLKITFYEQIGGEAEVGPRSGARSLIERTELSGDYVVQLSGEVFLPIVGAVAVAQQGPGEAERALQARAMAATGDRLKVSVVIAEREPVYVTGAAARAGVFKYTPGMVVAQAVALAGGDESGNDTWQRFDMAREQERMRKSVERMKRQLALIDVLAAERDGRRPQPSQRLGELAGARADDFVEVAREARALERMRLSLQIGALDKLIAATRSDLVASRGRLEQVAGVVRDRMKRRDELATRVSRGVSTENLIVQARNELVEVQSSWHEVRSAVARTEIRLLELERDREQALHAGELEVVQQLRAAHQAVAEEEIMLSSIGPLLLKMAPSVGLAAGQSETTYTLMRRTGAGPVRITADAMTALQPGDVVQVAKARQDFAAVNAQ